jgi:hypothetical protein
MNGELFDIKNNTRSHGQLSLNNGGATHMTAQYQKPHGFV